LNGIQLWKASAAGIPEVNTGRVPDTIFISDAGGTPMDVTVDHSAQAIFVEVTAHNFNSQETHFVLEFLPDL